MTTTIQIRKTTKQMLQMLKKKEQASSYDQIIQRLVRKRMGVPTSMFGTVKGARPRKSDRLKLNEL